MKTKTIAAKFGLFSILIILAISSQTGSAQTTLKNEISLVGNKVPTLINNGNNPARATNIIKKVMDNYSVSVGATTQAWSGSGLRNGKFIGYIDHYSLNVERNTYLYSQPYIEIPLHIASRKAKAIDTNRLDKIYRTTLGIENRFANTDELRSERSVRWARSPDFLSNIKQLADRRVDYIIADKFMLLEFNKMLSNINQKPLYLSEQSIYQVELRLAINVNTPNAETIIKQFNIAIEQLKGTNEYQQLLTPSTESVSLLDDALYEEILRKW